MRIVVDMQGAQTGSRLRGIGRYTLGLVKGLARNRGEHELYLALNGMMPEGIEAIRTAFAGLLPHENIRVWYALRPVDYAALGGKAERAFAATVYGQFIASLKPDAVFASSMMEGWGDDFFCDMRVFPKSVFTAGVVYDFMPHKYPKKHLNKVNCSWYEDRFSQAALLDQLVAISDFTCAEAKNYLPGVPCISISSACDEMFRRQKISLDEQTSLRARMGISRPFILYAGGLDERKNVPALIAAYGRLPSTLREKFQLVVVGGMNQQLQNDLNQHARRAGLDDTELVMPGRASDNDLCLLYNLCELFVFPSLEEGFGLPVLEAMNCGAPVIASNTTSIPEVVGLPDALFDPRDPQNIAAHMERSLTDETFRCQLVKNAETRKTLFSWDNSAKRALAAIEDGVRQRCRPVWPAEQPDRQFQRELCAAVSSPCTDRLNRGAMADCLAKTFPKPGVRQLLIDIGTLAQYDARTGIQRVVRSITTHLVRHPPLGYDIRPVYAAPDKEGYLYAHNSSIRLFGFDDGLDDDCPIDFSHNDIFLGLDLQLDPVQSQMPALKRMHQHGVRIYFVVYDLLPLRFPDYFSDGLQKPFEGWVRAIGQFDGIVGISRAVADETRDWLTTNAQTMPESFTWFHLGSDLEASLPTRGFPHEAPETLRAIASRPSLLMVGTIEPRKGHRLTLSAFERLWARGIDVNLVIVGNLGWKMNEFAAKLREHPEQGRHLFWLTGVSDEYLDKIYEASSAVLMASEGEGFGLAIVEGARHGKPLILRDIPVFHEIAGENAAYFSGTDAENLRAVIERWLCLYAEGKAPSSSGIRCLAWQESAEMLLSRLPLAK